MPAHVIDSLFFNDLYGTAEMRAVFDDHTLLQKWLDFEAALARAEASLGIIPAHAAMEITRKARADGLDIADIRRGIDETVHPLIALIWELANRCEGDAGNYVHWGATTQDAMDTAIVLQLKDAYPLLETSLNALIEAASALARENRDTVMAGRTHGQQALPITFGFKVAVWVAELNRHRQRFAESKPRVLTGQFGGAVGTLASLGNVGLEVNTRLMAELGLNVPLIAWHPARDNFAEFAHLLSMLSATLGKIAHEIIELQKQEFGELEEPFEMGKIGSSTMPQKRNPMLCEAILAVARLVRARSTTAVDAMLHEHERDWSSFQMEWAYLPEICVMTHGALALSLRVLSGLKVHADAMSRNLALTQGTLLAERIMLELGKDIGRQHAHDVIYAAAMRSIEQHIPFAEMLKCDPAVSAHLSDEQIDRLLDPGTYTGLASEFVDRVLDNG